MTRNEPWTPDSVRAVAESLFVPTWQTRLAEAISNATGMTFSAVRVRHWYLERNGRPIPGWLQQQLAPIFMEALLAQSSGRSWCGN